MLRKAKTDVPERIAQSPRGDGDRNHGEFPKSFQWRKWRIIDYAGPLPSLRPHLKASIADIPIFNLEKLGPKYIEWLLAEPETLCLEHGLAGARLKETAADRQIRLARRALHKEAAKAKEVRL